MAPQPVVSVVVCTKNRPECLERCLTALERDARDVLLVRALEIVVIDQSEGEASRRVCESFDLRYLRHGGHGLAASRNHALLHTRGDWIAFIDDDALVRPGWTETLLGEIARSREGGPRALAGTVYDAKSGALQFRNGVVHTDGVQVPVRAVDADAPGPGWTACAMGTNMAFERASLLEIDGFDPFYRYYHEESDVCVRLARAGGRLRFVAEWSVDHEFAPGDLRRDDADIAYGTIARSLVYFAGRHGDERGHARTLKLLRILFSKKAPPRLATRRLRKGRLPIGRWLAHVVAIGLGVTEALLALRNERADGPRGRTCA